MPVWLKTPAEIEAIRAVGAVLVRALDEAARVASPGAATRTIAEAFERSILASGAEPILKGLRRAGARPFPAACSVCVNEEVAHGIPGARTLRDGDLLTIDGAARLEGWCADAAVSVSLGSAARALRLIAAASDCVTAALRLAAPGTRWSSVAAGMHAAAADRGVFLIPGLDGHGTGRALHEPPRCWISGGPTAERPEFDLRAGMVLTIEPIVAESIAPTQEADDGWTTITSDGSWACHHEITFAVTRNGPDVLTRTAAVP